MVTFKCTKCAHSTKCTSTVIPDSDGMQEYEPNAPTGCPYDVLDGADWKKVEE